MKITLTQKELEKLYTFTKKLNNSEANSVFNSVFTEDHIDIIEVSAGDAELTVSVDDEIAIPFMEAFIKNAPFISTLFNANKLTLLCTAQNIFNSICADIRTAQNIATRLWRKKKYNTRLSCEDEAREYVKGCTDELHG